MNQKNVGSVGEKQIRSFLRKQKVRFIFDSSISFAFESYPKELGRKRFDFILIDDDRMPVACIEYDGIQHYEPNRYGRSRDEFSQACESDDIKTHFCEELRLPLLRVRYDQIDLIEDIVQEFLRYPSRYARKKHNPEMDMAEYWKPRSRYLQAA